MRPIPPDVWMMAIAIGKLQVAVEQTGNMQIAATIMLMQSKNEQFLKSTRKEKRK